LTGYIDSWAAEACIDACFAGRRCDV